jgi:hypothetical protein
MFESLKLFKHQKNLKKEKLPNREEEKNCRKLNNHQFGFAKLQPQLRLGLQSLGLAQKKNSLLLLMI